MKLNCSIARQLNHYQIIPPALPSPAAPLPDMARALLDKKFAFKIKSSSFYRFLYPNITQKKLRNHNSRLIGSPEANTLAKCNDRIDPAIYEIVMQWNTCGLPKATGYNETACLQETHSEIGFEF